MAPHFRPPLRPHESCQVRVDRIGREALPVVVIDNFLADAESLVEQAAQGTAFRLSPEIYPGARTPIPSPYPLAVYLFLSELIRDVFDLGTLAMIDSRADYAVLTKRPHQVAPLKRVPHTDTADPNFIVLLHYLCDPKHGGTSFYRHRATGFESARDERMQAYITAVESELAQAEPDHYLVDSNDRFERIAGYDAVFNRALIYRGVYVHGADIGRDYAYDPDPRTGRLTANSSFRFGQPLARPLAAPRTEPPMAISPGPWITTIPSKG